MFNVGDRVLIVKTNEDDRHLVGQEGIVVGKWGPFIDVTLDNSEMNLFENIDYSEKYVMMLESELERI